MDTFEFRSLIMKMGKRGLKRIHKIIQSNSIKSIRRPSTGLVMMSVKDSFDFSFYLGEVFVTEAEVEYEGHRGYGIVVGEEPDRAYIIAAIDAILQSNDETLKKRLTNVFLSQKKIIERKAKEEHSLIVQTKVNFQLMPR